MRRCAMAKILIADDECCFDCLMRTVNAGFDASLADPLSIQLQDFPIVRHIRTS